MPVKLGPPIRLVASGNLACNTTLPHSVQDWFHKAWFDGTIGALTHAEVGETLRTMRIVCLVADDLPGFAPELVAERVRTLIGRDAGLGAVCRSVFGSAA